MSEVSSARERIFAAGKAFQRAKAAEAQQAIWEAERLAELAKVQAVELRRRRIIEQFEQAFHLTSRGRLAQILIEVCEKHNVTPADIRCQRRQPAFVRARHECFWRARNETSLSYPSIGRFFDRDHTSVMHGVKMHEQRLAEGNGG